MARRSNRVVFNGWPSWRYGPEGQAAVFKCESDVPEGWTKKPDEQPEPYVQRHAPEVLRRDELVATLIELGVEINPLWGNAHMKKVIDDRSTAG